MEQQAIPSADAASLRRPPVLQRLIRRDKMPLLVLLLAALVGLLAGLVCGLFESCVHWLAQQRVDLLADQPQQGAETKAEQTELPPGAIGQQVDTLLGQPVNARLEQSAHQACQQADQGRQQEHQQRHLVPPYQALQDWRTTQRGRVGGRNGLLLHG
jgi:hypothetical protein